jgi:hypothetical protein
MFSLPHDKKRRGEMRGEGERREKREEEKRR